LTDYRFAMAFVETAVDVIRGAQTEIAIFLVAILAHWLFFGKHSVAGRRRAPKQALGTGAPKRPASPTSGLGPVQASPTVAAPAAFVRSVQALLRSEEAAQGLDEEIHKHLCRTAPEHRSDVLASLLAAVCRSSPPPPAAICELVTAARRVQRMLGFPAGVGLYEALLRSCLAAKATDVLGEVLADAEADFSSGFPSTLTVLATRGALQDGDLDAALARVPALASPWKSVSPSAAQGQLLSKLSRLALEREAIPRLLDVMSRSGLITPWAIEVLLVECAAAEALEDAMMVRTLAEQRKVSLTSGARGAIIRLSESAAEAVRLIEAAAAAKCFGKEVLLAAINCSERLSVAAPVTTAFLRMPAGKEAQATIAPEAATALLRLAAPGGVLAGKEDADAAVLELYRDRVAGVDLVADPIAERLVVDAALRRGSTTVLEQVLATFGDNSRHVGLLKRLSTERSLQDCVTVFKACTQKSACLYNTMIDVCIDFGDSHLAETYMAEATEAKVADVVTYNTIIKAHLRKGDMLRAREAMATMRELGLEPNGVTFNELLDAAASRGGSPEALWALVNEMKGSGCKPNHVTCSIVLKSISKTSRASDADKALAVVDEMDDAMDEVLLSSVCEACIRSGRHDLLRRQLNKQNGSRRVPIKGAHTFGSLMRAYGVLNDMEGVWEAWREMKRRHILPTSVTLGCVVEALAANGKVDEAYSLIREQLQDPHVRPMINAVIYCSVLKGYSHRKRFDRVWAVYDEMKAQGMQFSIVTYNTLVDACARSSDMGRIPALLDEMAKQGLQPNLITYSAIVKGYCKENRVDRAFELLEDMKKMDGFCPDEVTYNTLIDGCARYGMWDRGMSVLAEMEEVGVRPSAFTLSVLVKLANRSRRPERGFELVESLRAKYRIRLSVHVFNNLIHAATMQNDLDRALGVMVRMLGEKVRPDERSYGLLLRGAVAARAGNDVARLVEASLGGVAALRPTSPIVEAVTTEALEGIAGPCGDVALAVQLSCELRHASGVVVDPRVQARLTTMAASSSAPQRRR